MIYQIEVGEFDDGWYGREDQEVIALGCTCQEMVEKMSSDVARSIRVQSYSAESWQGVLAAVVAQDEKEGR